jgi:hypothetical protein
VLNATGAKDVRCSAKIREVSGKLEMLCEAWAMSRESKKTWDER